MNSVAPGAFLEPVAFPGLEGWPGPAVADAWRAFRLSAIARVQERAPLRPAQPADKDLMAVCAVAAGALEELGEAEAQAFFESRFAAFRIHPERAARGFVTGYYEPVVLGTPTRTSPDQAPILPRPADLVTFPIDQPPSPAVAGFSAGRRLPDGSIVPYPERALIEAEALGPALRPLVWLQDWTEVFLIHVQGSARVRLPDGAELRLTYAGRNGHPYTSIGRVLIESGEILPEAMSLARLKAWLRDAGQAVGERGRSLMQRNRSYIFFDAEPIDPVDESGPTGGSGLPLAAHISIAVDRALWPYGLPFWIETNGAVPGFDAARLSRLFVAQDTGSAIVGPARADLFMGSGDAAGRAAGAIRHDATVTVLLPRPS